MYQIYTEKSAGRVEIRFDSVISRGLEGFDETFRLACLVTGHAAGHFDLLVDYTHSQEMSDDVLAHAGERVQWCLDNGLRRSANITTDPEIKAQIDAISASPRIRTFASRAAAVEWLKSAEIIPLRHRG